MRGVRTTRKKRSSSKRQNDAMQTGMRAARSRCSRVAFTSSVATGSVLRPHASQRFAFDAVHAARRLLGAMRQMIEGEISGETLPIAGPF